MKYVLREKENQFLFFNFVTERWGPIEKATKFGNEEREWLERSDDTRGQVVKIESSTINYGIFGNSEVVRDEDGFIEIPVIVQESGLFAGAPPLELRIHEVAAHGEDEFNRQYTAKLNARTDLPFFLAKAKIKVDGATLVRHTIESNLKDGIEPLKA